MAEGHCTPEEIASVGYVCVCPVANKIKYDIKVYRFSVSLYMTLAIDIFDGLMKCAAKTYWLFT